jgi:hypothetical protein
LTVIEAVSRLKLPIAGHPPEHCNLLQGPLHKKEEKEEENSNITAAVKGMYFLLRAFYD